MPVSTNWSTMSFADFKVSDFGVTFLTAHGAKQMDNNQVSKSSVNSDNSEPLPFKPEDGWIKGSVSIPVPCDGVKFKSEKDAPQFVVDRIWYQKPLEVIKRAFSKPAYLVSFDMASLYSMYMYVGNQSQYLWAKPSEFTAHYIAYIPKVFMSWTLPHVLTDPKARWQDSRILQGTFWKARNSCHAHPSLVWACSCDLASFAQWWPSVCLYWGRSHKLCDEIMRAMFLSEDTPIHQSLWQNMSTSTFWTDSVSPTLHISLHIGSKLHSPQIVLSTSPSVPIPKHRRKCTPSYLTFESMSCHCCMYYHCCSC